MTETKITDSVWIENYELPFDSKSMFIVHNCARVDDKDVQMRRTNAGVMELRNNDEGPNYWCSKCGYVLDEGASMALRLFELEI